MCLKNLSSRNGGKKYLQYKCYLLWLHVHANVTSVYYERVYMRVLPVTLLTLVIKTWRMIHDPFKDK